MPGVPGAGTAVLAVAVEDVVVAGVVEDVAVVVEGVAVPGVEGVAVPGVEDVAVPGVGFVFASTIAGFAICGQRRRDVSAPGSARLPRPLQLAPFFSCL